MNTPFYTVCKADPTVQSLLGGPEPRIYPFGQAPQDVTKPYVVYQVIGGAPLNYLSCRPTADHTVLQVDAYGITSQSAAAVASAIRYAIELQSFLLAYRGDMRDEETKLYRTGFDVDWLETRD